MVNLKSSYNVMKEDETGKTKGLKRSLILAIIGILIGTAMFVILLILNFVNADTTDNATLTKLVIAFVPVFVATADIKKKDKEDNTFFAKEQGALIIIGVVYGLSLLIISIFASDWKDTIMTVGIELLVSIAAGFGISIVK